MSREIYKRAVAPHNMRVATDAGIPSDNVQAAILLMQDNLEFVGRDKFMCISPELFGSKIRTSAPYQFATKGYSANSPQREFGDELITNAADREFTSDTGFYSKGAGWTIADGVATVVGANSWLISNYSGTPGKFYRVEINVISISGGQMTVTMSNPWDIVLAITTPGKKTFVLSCSGSPAQFRIYAPNGLTATIDSVSLREVLAADLTQSTANSQPYLSKIAPSEPQGLQNTNGDGRFMSHPAISFAANEKWTVEVVAKLNGLQSVFCGSTNTGLYYRQASNAFRVVDNAGNPFTGTINANRFFGKLAHYSFVKDGNSLYVYINGVLYDTISVAGSTTLLFDRLMLGIIIYSGAYYGNTYHYSIIPDALSASRIAYRSALLRSIFPEIPTVKIAGLDVAVRALDIVCTPAGNLIANVTDNSAWAALTTAAWCHHGNDLALGTTYGKIYNGYAKDQLVADLASSNFGYHVATEAEWNAILATGVAGLKAMGTAYWTSANGTNVSGLTLLGGGLRKDTDGVFAENKIKGVYWCADSDKIIQIAENNSTATTATNKKFGAYVLLIKNY